MNHDDRMAAVIAHFEPALQHQDYKIRARARRAVLAAQKGGRCEQLGCTNEIHDFSDFGRDAPRDNRFEFDHLQPVDRFEYSDVTGLKQFRISGNDCARRKWQTVRRHALQDTQLLCRECHYQYNKQREEWRLRSEGYRAAVAMTNEYGQQVVPPSLQRMLQ